jgi:Ca2+-binding RTX toxin-like protein
MPRSKSKPIRKFERLEDRQMMAADINLDNGVLTIQGTDESNHITVQPYSDGTLRVTVTNETQILTEEWVDQDDVDEIVAYGRNGDDQISITGNFRAKLYGGNGNDRLSSSNGNDLLDGGANDDVLSGYGGNDELIGGTGNDRYEFGSGSDVVYEGDAADTDTLSFQFHRSGINLNLASTATQIVSADLTLRLSSATGIENVEGTYFYNDTIRGNSRNNVLKGYYGNDALYGFEGDDDLFGGNDTDSLYGGTGNDHLFGEAGKDWLYGEAGLDTLDGGADNDFLDGGRDGYVDVLKGGSGADTFVKYKKRTNPLFDYEQKVLDYNSAVDTVLTVWY